MIKYRLSSPLSGYMVTTVTVTNLLYYPGKSGMVFRRFTDYRIGHLDDVGSVHLLVSIGIAFDEGCLKLYAIDLQAVQESLLSRSREPFEPFKRAF